MKRVIRRMKNKGRRNRFVKLPNPLGARCLARVGENEDPNAIINCIEERMWVPGVPGMACIRKKANYIAPTIFVS